MARKLSTSPAQVRRRTRRAAEREPAEVLVAAGATAKKDFPLSDRDTAWDAGEANQRWQKECGIGGDNEDWAKFRSGYLWFDPDNQEQVGGGKLPYVDVIGGTPTAVWGAITAAAGGHGIDATKGIPAADKDAVKKTISAWYAVARKQYNDKSITAPWDEKGEGAAEGDRFAALRARASLAAAADLPWDSEEGLMDVMSDISALLNPGDSWGWGVVDVAIGGGSAILCDWEKGEYWLVPISYDDEKEPVLPPASEWTPVESQWVAEEASVTGWERHQQEASARAAGFAARPACASCDDAYTDHLGTDGPCTVDDCDCTSYEAPEEASAVVPIIVRGPAFGSDFAKEVAEAVGREVRMVFDRLPALAADGATAPPLPDEHQPAEKIPRRRPTPRTPDAPATAAAPSSGLEWTATLCPEGSPTDDGRIFAPDAIDWRDLPLTLMAMTNTSAEGGHDGALVAGRIDRIWREGNLIRASGEFDPGDYGVEIARMVGDGTLRGVSVDLAISEMEIAYRSDVLDADGNWIGGSGPVADGDGVPVFLGGDEDVMLVVWHATIGMATVCPFQAFAGATISLTDSLAADGTPNPSPNPFLWTYTGQAGYTVVKHDPAAPASLEASASAVADSEPIEETAEADLPPADWFADPEFAELTALTVDDDGRVSGHAAAWDVCHTGFPDVCVIAPHSRTGYAYFHLKEVVCRDGERISCGTITFDTGHAGGRLSRAEATRHYDHTGTAAADVVVGEDEYGIWVAGAMRPGTSEETYRKIRGAVLSGDWRNVNDNLELVALLAVNVPGFPVPRVKAMIASADDGTPQVLSLTAAGITDGDGDGDDRLSAAVREQFAALGDRARGRYAELAERTRATVGK